MWFVSVLFEHLPNFPQGLTFQEHIWQVLSPCPTLYHPKQPQVHGCCLAELFPQDKSGVGDTRREHVCAYRGFCKGAQPAKSTGACETQTPLWTCTGGRVTWPSHCTHTRVLGLASAVAYSSPILVSKFTLSCRDKGSAQKASPSSSFMGQDSHGASVGLLSGADGLVNRSGRQNTGPTDAANACREPPGAQEARTSPPPDSKEVVLPSTLVLVQGDPCWPLEIQGCWVINLCCSKPLTCGMVICYRNSRETIEMNINRNQVTENMRYSSSAWGGRLRWSLTKSRGKTAFQMQRWDSPRGAPGRPRLEEAPPPRLLPACPWGGRTTC